MDILKVIAPVMIAGIIVLFVIIMLKQKYKEGNLGKKRTKSAQVLLDSLIPFGMLIGCTVGVLVGMFFPVSQLISVSLGASIGYLFGYFAYSFSSERSNS